MRRHWGGLPTGATGVLVWAEAVAARQADTDPRVSETWQGAERAHRAWRHLTERHLHESAKLNQQVLGSATPSTAITRAAGWRTRAEKATHDLAGIETLPVTDAAQRDRDRDARAEAEREAVEHAQAARDARATRLGQFRPSSDHGGTRPNRDGFGI